MNIQLPLGQCSAVDLHLFSRVHKYHKHICIYISGETAKRQLSKDFENSFALWVRWMGELSETRF